MHPGSRFAPEGLFTGSSDFSGVLILVVVGQQRFQRRCVLYPDGDRHQLRAGTLFSWLIKKTLPRQLRDVTVLRTAHRVGVTSLHEGVTRDAIDHLRDPTRGGGSDRQELWHHPAHTRPVANSSVALIARAFAKSPPDEIIDRLLFGE